MKIGVCQTKIVEGNIEENILHIENIIKSHIDKKLDLICFPELCISGYDFDVLKDNFNEKAIFSMLSKKYNIKILAGVASFEDDKYYDVVCIWSEDGEIIFEYKKIHLWAEERSCFENGEKIDFIEIDNVKIGVLICADLGFPEVSNILAMKGCDVIIIPSAWHAPYGNMFKLLAKARAIENQMYIITVNRAAGNINYCGNSCCCDPSGNIIAQSNTISEDYFEISIDTSKVEEKRKEIPWLKMRLPHVYKKYDS